MSRSYPSGASKRRPECERKKNDICKATESYDILSSKGEVNLPNVLKIRLNCYALMSIENGILREIDLNSLVS